MNPGFSLKKFLTSAATHVGALLVLSAALFAGYVYHSNAEVDTRTRQVAIRESIIASSPVPLDSFSISNRAAAESLLVVRSPRAGELRTLQARAGRQNLTASIFGVAALLTFMASLMVGGWYVARHWRGEGLPAAEVEARRVRVQVWAIITTTVVLAGMVVVWRYRAGEIREGSIEGPVIGSFLVNQYLIVVAGLTVAAVIQAWLVWWVLGSPNSRVGQALSKAPKLYRTSVQSVIVAVLALVSANDVVVLSQGWFLVLQMVGWLGIAVALSSVMLAYLTPRKSTPVPPLPDPSVTGAEPMESVPVVTGVDGVGKGKRRRVPVSREVRHDLARMVAQIQEVSARMDQAARSAAKPSTADEALRLQANRMRERLQEEVHSLTTRGNLNLSIGIVTTLLAVGMLWWLVLDPPPSSGTNRELISHFVPRLSVAVFIEVFSFFFLRLYRNGLADIKYYQNEMTTIESRILALEVAVMSSRPEPVDEILRGLSTMDRNMVLRQGETTAELERLRIEQQNLRTVVDGMVSRIPAPSSTPQGTGTGAAVG